MVNDHLVGCFCHAEASAEAAEPRAAARGGRRGAAS